MTTDIDQTVPADIAELIGRPQYPDTADFPAELGYGWNTLAATENGNPLYWDDGVAGMLTGGRSCPSAPCRYGCAPTAGRPARPASSVPCSRISTSRTAWGFPRGS